MHRAVGRLLGELAPLLLVLDDLHWADDASTELLGSLVRRGLAPGVLLALGYRTGRAPPRLSATLAAPSVQRDRAASTLERGRVPRAGR